VGGFFATVIVLGLLALFFAVLRWIGYAATGRLKPLTSPLEDADPTARTPVAFVDDPDDKVTPIAAFERYKGAICELHGSPYCAVSVFKLVRPPSSFDVGGAVGPTTKGRCYLLSCTACVTEAYRWRAFVWARDNQAVHPDWASAALYPFLLKSQYFELDDEVARPIWDSALPAPPTPLAGALDRLEPKLADLAACGDGISVAPALSAEALRSVLQDINRKPDSARVLLAGDVVAVKKGLVDSFAITLDGFYEVSGSVRLTAFDSMGDLALSKDGLSVVAGGRKLKSPFIRVERRKRFATALHAVLSDMRNHPGVSRP
jgi:hypothetical protein